jgi:NAD(P)H-flavin reductase
MSEVLDAYEWKITNRVKETHNVYTYILAPNSKSQKFLFELGQFVMVGVFLRRPTASGKMEESFVQRAYSHSFIPSERKFRTHNKRRKAVWIYQS